MRIAALVVLWSLAAVSPVARAVEGNLPLARKLVEVLEVKAVFESHSVACRIEVQGSPFDPRAVLQREPGAFGGITPQSSYWPEVEAVFKRYQELSCSRVSPGELAEFCARRYAEHGSPEDLQAAIDFYSSEIGKRLVRVNQEVNVELNKYSLELAQAAARELFPQHYEAVRAIAERYRMAPR
jgi:hypothetical protein